MSSWPCNSLNPASGGMYSYSCVSTLSRSQCAAVVCRPGHSLMVYIRPQVIVYLCTRGGGALEVTEPSQRYLTNASEGHVRRRQAPNIQKIGLSQAPDKGSSSRTQILQHLVPLQGKEFKRPQLLYADMPALHMHACNGIHGYTQTCVCVSVLVCVCVGGGVHAPSLHSNPYRCISFYRYMCIKTIYIYIYIYERKQESACPWMWVYIRIHISINT